MFGRHKKPSVTVMQRPSSDLLSRLTSRTAKETKISEYETAFFIALEEQMKIEGLSIDYFYAERMGSGSIRLDCPSGIIGTVHLRKKIGEIQYFISAYDHHNMRDAPIEAIIAVIPYWIGYAKQCMHTHKQSLSY